MVPQLAFPAGAASMNLTPHKAGLWAPFNTGPFTHPKGYIKHHHCKFNREFNPRGQELLQSPTERTVLQALENI